MPTLTITTGGRKRRISAREYASGCFSVVYVLKSKVYILTDSQDRSKDLLASLPPMPHLPRLKLLQTIRTGERVFTSPRYRSVHQSPNALAQYRALEQAFDDRPSYFARSVANHAQISPQLKKAVRVLCTAADDEDFFIDLRTDNVAVDRRGRLILLDLLAPA